MSNPRINFASSQIRQLLQPGGLLNYGPDLTRLLVHMLRVLAEGHPISPEQRDQITGGQRLPREGAIRFLEQVSERDAAGNIVGIMGLTLNQTSHRLQVDGTWMSAWCAQDTLFLPVLLTRTAIIESTSPLSGEKIRLTVSPDRVDEVSPPGAVVTTVLINPDKLNLSSVEAIWTTFCHHIFFFTSREEAERWAAGKTNIAVLSMDEAYALGQEFASSLLAVAQAAIGDAGHAIANATAN